jgi:hypothetical protein
MHLSAQVLYYLRSLVSLTRHLFILSVYYIHIYDICIHTCIHAYIYNIIHTHGHTLLEQLGATFHGGDHLIAYPWGDFIHCPPGNYGCKRTPSDERTDYVSPVSLFLFISLSLSRSLSLCMYLGKRGWRVQVM